MEVKSGNQRLSARVRRQVLRDSKLIAAEGEVKSVRWVFYVKKGQHVSKEVTEMLESNGIEWIERGFVR